MAAVTLARLGQAGEREHGRRGCWAESHRAHWTPPPHGEPAVGNSRHVAVGPWFSGCARQAGRLRVPAHRKDASRAAPRAWPPPEKRGAVSAGSTTASSACEAFVRVERGRRTRQGAWPATRTCGWCRACGRPRVKPVGRRRRGTQGGRHGNGVALERVATWPDHCRFEATPAVLQGAAGM
jgi:hypothetical protein